jgi:hypothetical protein
VLATVLSLLMLATIALTAGAVFLWRRTGERGRPLLMLVLAGVMLVNVAIWTLPDAAGEAPATRLAN